MKKLLADLFENWKTIPNLLSFLRILMVPLFAYIFVHDEIPHNVLWSVVIIGLSGLTDLFDGKIARRFNQISNLGKILDPVADKLTVITVAILLLIKFRAAQDPMIQAFGWVFIVFLAKDAFMVVGGAAMIAFGIRPGAAEIYGKVSTCVFYGVMLLVVAFGKEVGALQNIWTMPPVLMGILVIIAAVSTLVAFLSYVPGIKRQVHERFHGDKSRDEIIE